MIKVRRELGNIVYDSDSWIVTVSRGVRRARWWFMAGEQSEITAFKGMAKLLNSAVCLPNTLYLVSVRLSRRDKTPSCSHALEAKQCRTAPMAGVNEAGLS